MSKPSFLSFHYGAAMSRTSPSSSFKSSSQSSLPKERQKPSTISRVNSAQPNANQEMRWVFNKFDTNKDGKISKEEYKSALKVLGRGNVAEKEVTKSFKFVDSDGDGFIDFKEFKEMMRSGNNMGGDEYHGVKKNDIQGAFKLFDLNGDSKISAEELMEVLRRMGERCSLDSCKRMIGGVDADGDGLIDMDEFMKMMTRTRKVT